MSKLFLSRCTLYHYSTVQHCTALLATTLRNINNESCQLDQHIYRLSLIVQSRQKKNPCRLLKKGKRSAMIT